MNYKTKYLKYKSKYLKLKGGMKQNSKPEKPKFEEVMSVESPPVTTEELPKRQKVGVPDLSCHEVLMGPRMNMRVTKPSPPQPLLMRVNSGDLGVDFEFQQAVGVMETLDEKGRKEHGQLHDIGEIGEIMEEEDTFDALPEDIPLPPGGAYSRDLLEEHTPEEEIKAKHTLEQMREHTKSKLIIEAQKESGPMWWKYMHTLPIAQKMRMEVPQILLTETEVENAVNHTYRIDSTDGKVYTRAEFIKRYKEVWEKKWNSSEYVKDYREYTKDVLTFEKMMQKRKPSWRE